VHSARRLTCHAVTAVAVVLLLAIGASGCQTTQDKAAAKQAESELILEKRAQKRRAQADEKGSEKR